jgi:hypothetical protein
MRDERSNKRARETVVTSGGAFSSVRTLAARIPSARNARVRRRDCTALRRGTPLAMPGVIVSQTRDEIIREIQRHRSALIALESQLAEPATTHWPPVGFYLTFYVVAGTTIGILGSLTSFIFHVLGSLMVNQDPLMFLRVYGTVFLGPWALTTDDLNFFMLVAVVHFSLGAIAGAVFHVLVNRFVPDRTGLQIGLGVLYGLLMWIVNFYLILSWLQPRLVGEAFVLELMPAWIAALTHVIYGLTLGLLQPLGRFVPYRPAVQS